MYDLCCINMCRLCKMLIPAEEMVKMLNEALKESNEDIRVFEGWNTTSVYFMFCSALGIDGLEARDIALKLLYNFSKWVATQPVYYLPSSGLECMWHPDVINKLYLYALNFNNPFKLSDEELFELVGRKVNEFNVMQKNMDRIKIGVGLGVVGVVLGFVGCLLCLKV